MKRFLDSAKVVLTIAALVLVGCWDDDDDSDPMPTGPGPILQVAVSGTCVVSTVIRPDGTQQVRCQDDSTCSRNFETVDCTLETWTVRQGNAQVGVPENGEDVFFFLGAGDYLITQRVTLESASGTATHEVTVGGA